MSFLDFKVEDLPEDGGSFEPVPAGWYQVQIKAAEVVQTKAGTGEYIKLRLDILGPTHEGRVLFANLNIRNPSVASEDIAHKQLGAIMRAIGLAHLQDSDQLVGGMLMVKVSIKSSEQYGDSNEVKAFKAIDGSAPPKSAPAAQKPASDSNEAVAAPPWASK